MIHELIITPLNCGFGSTINNFTSFYEDEYNARTDRAVLFYEPNISKFKLKAISNEFFPYIEPTLLGINSTDLIEIQFEAMKVGDMDTCVRIDLLEINANNEIPSRSINHELAVTESYYKTFNVRCSLENFTNTMKGLVLNLRNKVANSELLLKNVKLKIHTSNSDFRINEDYIYLNNKEDIENTILATVRNGVSSNSIYRCYKDGILELTEDGELNSVADTTKFRGLSLLLEKKKAPIKVAVYLEYKNDTDKSLRVNDFFVSSSSTTNAIYLPVSTGWTRKVVYVNNLISKTNNELVNLEIGTSVSTARFSIRNIIICNLSYNREFNSLYKYLNIDNQIPCYLKNIALCKKYLIQKSTNVDGGWKILTDYTQDTLTISQLDDYQLQCTYGSDINANYNNRCVAFAQVTSDKGATINVRVSSCMNGTLKLKFFNSNGEAILLSSVPNEMYFNLIVIL